MAAVDKENIDFDVEISEENDLDIVLASTDKSLETVMTEEDVNTEEYENLDRIPNITSVKEDSVFLVIHEQHDVELRFVRHPVQTTIHKLPPKLSAERSAFIWKIFQISIFLDYSYCLGFSKIRQTFSNIFAMHYGDIKAMHYGDIKAMHHGDIKD